VGRGTKIQGSGFKENLLCFVNTFLATTFFTFSYSFFHISVFRISVFQYFCISYFETNPFVPLSLCKVLCG